MTWDIVLGLSPLLIIAVGSLVLMTIEALSRMHSDGTESPSASLASASTVVLLASGFASLGLWMYGPEKREGLKQFEPYLVNDRFSLLFYVILTLGGALTTLLAGGYRPEHKLDRGEFYPLVMLSTLGAAGVGLDMTMYMVHNQTMIRVNIAEAKTQLSRHLERVERGETIVLCRRNVPVAEIRPLSPQRSTPRPVGIDRGMQVPEIFFDPLPDEVLDAFEGGSRR